MNAVDPEGTNSPKLSSWQRHSWLIVVGILAFTLAGGVVEYRGEVSNWRARSDELAARVAEMLKVVEGTVTATAAGSALVDVDGSVDPRQFRRYAETLLADPGVLSVAIEKLISGAQRQALEAELGRPIFTIEDGEVVPSPESPEHLVIVEVWPEAFRDIIGRDLLADPIRGDAALEAEATRSVTLTQPIPLALSESTGVLVMVPLFPLSGPRDDVTQNTTEMTGMLTVGVFADVFLADIVSQLRVGTRLRIEDGGVLLAETASPPGGTAGSAVAPVANRTWTVTVESPEGIDYTDLLAFSAIGLAVATLVGVASWQSLVHGHKLEAAHGELAALVANMQRDLLKDQFILDELGLSAVVRYEPAAEHANLGGDWYDIFLDKEGEVVMAVGDVTGHGVDAVLHMHQIRQLVNAYAFDGNGPGHSITLANRVLNSVGTGELLTSLWLAKLDPRTGVVAFASAGHPPPLLTYVDKEPIELDGKTGPLLNLAPADTSWDENEIDLPPGSLLAIYTDGVIEAPGLSLDQGISLAKAAIGDPTRPLDDIAADILAARPDPGRDDAALLLLRVAEGSTTDTSQSSESATSGSQIDIGHKST